MNVLVTGGSGFIGLHLIRRLLSLKNKVYVIVREKTNLKVFEDIADDIEAFVFCDNVNELASFMSEKQIGIVVHLASLFIAEHATDDINELIKSNILFGTQILEAMKISGVLKLINVGTSWQHYKESKAYLPVCLYASTKEAFEKILEYYVSAENMKVITFKLFDTYGTNDTRKKLLNLLIASAQTKSELNMSEGKQLIDMVYIDDVIDNFIAGIDILQNRDIKHEKYFISNKHRITLREFIKLFEQIFNVKLNINWGKRPYRKREVMIPYEPENNEILIKTRTSLKEGLLILHDSNFKSPK